MQTATTGLDSKNQGAIGAIERIELVESERTRCEIWTRVMGYHRPIGSWNPGKQSEHKERCYFRALPADAEEIG